MTKSTLSVIMANYNHGHYIGAAIEAIATQTVSPTEFLIIDDGSTDDSVNIILENAKRFPFIRLIQNKENYGTVQVVALAREEVSGDFIFLAAADDLVMPGCFEKSIKLLDAHSNAGMCSSEVMLIDEDGSELGIRPEIKILKEPGYISPSDASIQLKKFGGWFYGTATIYRRSCLDELDWFDHKLGSFCDGYVSALIALRWGVCFVPTPLSALRLSPSSLSFKATTDTLNAAAMLNYARNQMETIHKDFFSPEYVDLWERRWRYTISSNLLRDRGRAVIGEIGQILPPWGALGRFMVSVLGAFDWSARHVLPIYLLLRLAPQDILLAVSRRLNL